MSHKAIALIVLAVPMALIAAIVKWSTPGPVFYRQERMGLHGKTYRLWKFRSMRTDAEKNGAVRWIELGVGQLQPSEFLKPFFVVTLAWLLSLKEKDGSLPVFSVSAVLLATVAVMLMKQPDFGSTIIYGVVWIAMLALASQAVKHLPALRRRRELLRSKFEKAAVRRGWIAYPEYWQ